MTEQPLIHYEVLDGAAIISLNRPDVANAQNTELLLALDGCWTRAIEDDAVRVIIVRANGKHFSAGHDMRSSEADLQLSGVPIDTEHWTVDKLYAYEAKIYLGLAEKWRDAPKPSIAAVQGKCIAAGLLLCWPCDLIIAADNALFSDPTAFMGIGGVEYHGHTWELGARKAKELLFLGSALSAVDAERLGMVNKVVPLAELDAAARDWAKKIAAMPPFAIRQAKRSVNQTLDIMGFHAAVRAVFEIHQVQHGNAISQCGVPVMAGLEQMRRS